MKEGRKKKQQQIQQREKSKKQYDADGGGSIRVENSMASFSFLKLKVLVQIRRYRGEYFRIVIGNTQKKDEEKFLSGWMDGWPVMMMMMGVISTAKA